MDNNLSLDKQNIDNFNQYEEGTKEYLLEKFNISVDGYDEDNLPIYFSNRNNLRNFFLELEKLENNN